MGRKPKVAVAAAAEKQPPAAVTRRSTRRGRNRSDSESEEPLAPPPPAVNYCEDSPDSNSDHEDDYSPNKKSPNKRGGRRGRGNSRSAATSSGSDREAARTPKPRGGGRGRRGGVSALSASPVAKDLSVVFETPSQEPADDDPENGRGDSVSMETIPQPNAAAPVVHREPTPEKRPPIKLRLPVTVVEDSQSSSSSNGTSNSSTSSEDQEEDEEEQPQDEQSNNTRASTPENQLARRVTVSGGPREVVVQREEQEEESQSVEIITPSVAADESSSAEPMQISYNEKMTKILDTDIEMGEEEEEKRAPVGEIVPGEEEEKKKGGQEGEERVEDQVKNSREGDQKVEEEQEKQDQVQVTLGSRGLRRWTEQKGDEKQAEKEEKMTTEVTGKLEHEVGNEPLQPPGHSHHDDKDEDVKIRSQQRGDKNDDKEAASVAAETSPAATKSPQKSAELSSHHRHAKPLPRDTDRQPEEEKDEKPKAEQSKEAEIDERKVIAESKQPEEANEVAAAQPQPPPPARKRRWTSRKADVEPVIAITTDSLKGIIEDVRPVSVSDMKMESSPEPEERRTAAAAASGGRKQRRMVADDEVAAQQHRQLVVEEKEDGELNETNEEGEVREEDDEQKGELEEGKAGEEKSLPASEENGMQVDEKEDRAAEQQIKREKLAQDGDGEVKKDSVFSRLERKVSIVDEPLTKKTIPGAGGQKQPNPSSNVLFITNLVRPFTLLQLKALLARTGKIVPENGFWIDKIKSKCFVHYETEDEAVETRHALNGVRWPASNPKVLHVEFSSEAAIQRAIESTAGDGVLVAAGGKVIDLGAKDRGIGGDRSAADERRRDPIRTVREWDLGKRETVDDDGARGKGIGGVGRERGDGIEEVGGGRGDRQREGMDAERKRSSASPDRRQQQPYKNENEPPRLLDDLFRKTKTTPCIYWLPLTPEQIAVKEEARRKHMEEREKRLEQIQKEKEEERLKREAERKEREKNRSSADREKDRNRSRERNRYRSRSNDRRRDRSRSRDDRRRYR